jgi:hypothetical protein
MTAPGDDQMLAAMRDALENLLIALSMGWDLDGVVEVAQAALKADEQARAKERNVLARDASAEEEMRLVREAHAVEDLGDHRSDNYDR